MIDKMDERYTLRKGAGLGLFQAGFPIEFRG
jgi:hypothetical protein